MNIEWNLWINNSVGMQIKGNDGEEPIIELFKGEITADQQAAMHFVVEIARCLLIGKSIDHTFNPTRTPERVEEEEKLVRCHWMKNGKLVMMGECSKRWKHAHNVEEAMLRERVFTCTRVVYDSMSKRRPAKAKHKPTPTKGKPCDEDKNATD